MTFKTWKDIEGDKVPSTSGYSEKLFNYTLPGKTVLDLGCGYGRLSGLFKDKGCIVYGIDINEQAVKEASSNPELEGINFSVQDAIKTNFEDNFFDVIVTQAVLACMVLEDRKKVVKEILRILKPGGVLHIGEFGLTDKEDYEAHAKITGEYGTVVVRNEDGSERFRSHNFSKEELDGLLNDFELISYEELDFVTVKGNKHPGHVYIVRK